MPRRADHIPSGKRITDDPDNPNRNCGCGCSHGGVGLAIGPFLGHIVGMKYTLEIKHHDALPNPFKWEIYEEGNRVSIERSQQSYSSRAKAEEAGAIALKRWEIRRR